MAPIAAPPRPAALEERGPVGEVHDHSTVMVALSSDNGSEV
jgi:hypothetical protein